MAITFRDIFSSSDLSTFGTPLTIADIITSMLLSLATGIFIFYIYKKTYSGVLYSQNFNTTIIMATLVGSVVMMAIGGNLALALGMVGALSIIRFRTPIKDPKDITFLFWAITSGIVNGIRFYKLSITSSLIIGATLLILSKRVVITKPFILILKYTDIDLGKVEDTLKRYCSKHEIRSTTADTSAMTERTIEIKIKGKHQDRLISELKKAGAKQVMLFSHQGHLTE